VRAHHESRITRQCSTFERGFDELIVAAASSDIVKKRCADYVDVARGSDTDLGRNQLPAFLALLGWASKELREIAVALL
jgi:hypothetical protein